MVVAHWIKVCISQVEYGPHSMKKVCQDTKTVHDASGPNGSRSKYYLTLLFFDQCCLHRVWFHTSHQLDRSGPATHTNQDSNWRRITPTHDRHNFSEKSTFSVWLTCVIAAALVTDPLQDKDAIPKEWAERCHSKCLDHYSDLRGKKPVPEKILDSFKIQAQ